MQSRGFEEAVRQARERNPRFDAAAFTFLREALDLTLKNLRQTRSEGPRHVRGQELLEGFRQHALEEFGPMARLVLEQWGVRACEDVGEMVFLLVEVGAFGRTEQDSMDDFRSGYDFRDAFDKPFQPRGSAGRPAVTKRTAGRRRR